MARSGGSFKPGQSGNPGGKHKVSKELRLFAQEFTEEAILGLVEIARDKTNTAAARATAWNSVLDRGHGKPMQAIEHSGSVKTHEEALAALAAIPDGDDGPGDSSPD